MVNKIRDFLDATSMTAHTGCMPGRFGATIEQIGLDLKEGIEGKDVIDDSLRIVRNTAVATWHAVNGVIPSIANAFNGQQYDVVERKGALDGTKNSFQKIVHTKGVLGKASAVFLEATDGPVDDAFNLFGGAKHMIVPQTRGNAYKLLHP
jgi:hypothetical protein